MAKKKEVVEETAESTETTIEAPELEAPIEKKVKSKKLEDTVEEKKPVKLTPKKYQHGKKYRALENKIEKGKVYSVEEGISLVKNTSVTKFDAAVEIHVNLGIDPSNAEHQIRGSVSMPAGIGKEKKICAIVGPDKDKEVKAAGADYVGGQDLVGKIEKGWTDFDVVVATPDMMAHVGKIGKILGTKGLMPNPKTGTVTNDPAKAVSEIKKGKADYKIDKQGSLHAAIGRVSFKEEDILANYNAFMEAVRHAKPASLKGTYIKSIFLTSSMGPSAKIEK